MFKKLNINKQVLNLLTAIGGGILMLFIIGFVGKKQYDVLCQKVIIDIDDSEEKFFIDEKEVIDIVNAAAGADVLGARAGDINLVKLEAALEQNNFVENAEAYRDLKGNLRISISQKTPLGRIISSGPHAYFDSKGDLLPLSDSYTARVVTVYGDKTRDILKNDFLKTEEGQKYIEFFRYINEDEFWKKQAAEIEINRYGEITIMPQVGQQLIEFGEPDNMELKFKKLKIFYKKILPAKGWAAYKRVNVKYTDQIICE